MKSVSRFIEEVLPRIIELESSGEEFIFHSNQDWAFLQVGVGGTYISSETVIEEKELDL